MRAKGIYPRQKPKDASFFMRRLATGVREYAEETREKFKLTTATWESENPVFARKVEVRGTSKIVCTVWTRNKVYIMLVRGRDKPYVIPRTVRFGRYLRYRKGYISKTTPGVLGSGSGGAGGQWRKKLFVLHPGYKAREFDKAVADVMRPRAAQVMKEAISQWMKSSKM